MYAFIALFVTFLLLMLGVGMASYVADKWPPLGAIFGMLILTGTIMLIVYIIVELSLVIIHG